MSEDIRIYVADLAAYNNGKLHGVWVNVCNALDDILAEVHAMLDDSPEELAEEYAIHDYEGFDGYPVGEYEGIDNVHEIACFIEEHPKLAGGLLSQFNGNVDEARQAMEDGYCGCYSSVADYAQELTEETSLVPKQLAFYIDYERMGRDMEMSGDICTIQTAHDEIHVFWNH